MTDTFQEISLTKAPMTSDKVYPQPPNSFRVTIEIFARISRMDTTLLTALKNQTENSTLKNISRQGLKNLFLNGKIQIKGQRAKPSSALAKGITYIDVLQ